LELEERAVLLLLESTNLNVSSETVVFMAAMKWIDADRPNRKKLLSSFLPLIRFPHMNLDYLCDVVCEIDIIKQEPDFQVNLRYVHYFADSPSRNMYWNQLYINRVRVIEERTF
jgi:hypothetical protein